MEQASLPVNFSFIFYHRDTENTENRERKSRTQIICRLGGGTEPNIINQNILSVNSVDEYKLLCQHHINHILAAFNIKLKRLSSR